MHGYEGHKKNGCFNPLAWLSQFHASLLLIINSSSALILLMFQKVHDHVCRGASETPLIAFSECIRITYRIVLSTQVSYLW